jgi:hypothetical protein
MRFSHSHKAFRALRLLIGLGHPAIGAALRARGMTRDDMNEGWALLRRLGPEDLAEEWVDPRRSDFDEPLRAWHTRWYEVASAALRRHAPQVHAHLFPKLRSGPRPGRRRIKAILALVDLDARWQRIDEWSGATDDDRAKAREALAHVGVTNEVFAELDSLLGPVNNQPAARTPGPDRDGRDRAEAALWAWYLQWSTIARDVLKHRGLLRQLGFLGERKPPPEFTSSDPPRAPA